MKMDSSEYKNCPHCDEEIKMTALKCKYCKSLLYNQSLANNNMTKKAYKLNEPVNEIFSTKLEDEHSKDFKNNRAPQITECFNCGKALKPNANFCTDCGCRIN